MYATHQDSICSSETESMSSIHLAQNHQGRPPPAMQVEPGNGMNGSSAVATASSSKPATLQLSAPKSSALPATFIQLGNLAGLSTPTNRESSSQKRSAVSSLSSDDDAVSNAQSKSEQSESDVDGSRHSRQQGTIRINTGFFQEHLVFRKLFHERDDDGGRNPYIEDVMRVESTQQAEATVFANRLCYVQQLHFHQGAIWCLKFSPSGQFLVTGGQDGRVVVWTIGGNVRHSAGVSSASSAGGSGSSTERSNSRDSQATESPHAVDTEESFDVDDSPSPDDGSVAGDFMSATPEMLGQMGHTGRNNSTESATNSNSESYRSSSFDGSESPYARSIHDIIYPEPHRVFEGHTADIIDVSFSKAHFLLSASIDKTVRLWHVSRADCLQLFTHPDIVTTVEFHPKHDRFFVSGCFDMKLRVWDVIPDGAVKELSPTPDTITSVKFSPDGETIACGLINGQVQVFMYEGLRVVSRLDCKDVRGRHSTGSKVTGMSFRSHASGGGSSGVGAEVGVDGTESDTLAAAAATPAASGTGIAGAVGSNSLGAAAHRARSAQRNLRNSVQQLQLLVTTNDSRIRLCRLDNSNITCKYKAKVYKNKSMQIKASFSENSKFVICGSDTGSVVIWRTERFVPERFLLLWRTEKYRRKYRNAAHESFNTTGGAGRSAPLAATVAVFASSNTVRHIIKSQVPNLYSQQDVLARYQSARAQLSGNVAEKNVAYGSVPVPSYDVMDSIYSRLPTDDLCSRVIVTADLEGRIHVFFRLGPAVDVPSKSSAGAGKGGADKRRAGGKGRAPSGAEI